MKLPAPAGAATAAPAAAESAEPAATAAPTTAESAEPAAEAPAESAAERTHAAVPPAPRAAAPGSAAARTAPVGKDHDDDPGQQDQFPRLESARRLDGLTFARNMLKLGAAAFGDAVDDAGRAGKKARRIRAIAELR